MFLNYRTRKGDIAMAKSKKRKKHNKGKKLDNANIVFIDKLKDKYDYIDIDIDKDKSLNDILEKHGYKNNIYSQTIFKLLDEMFLYKALVKINSRENGMKTTDYIYYEYNNDNKCFKIFLYSKAGMKNRNPNEYRFIVSYEAYFKNNNGELYINFKPMHVFDNVNDAQVLKNIMHIAISNILYRLLFLRDILKDKRKKYKHSISVCKSNKVNGVVSNPPKNIIVLGKDITVYTSKTPKSFTRNYNCKTNTWNVAGHYRHYKSGKVVFIKPSIRKRKDIKNKEIKSKEYKL